MKKIIIILVVFLSTITVSNALYYRTLNVSKEHGGIGGLFNRYSDVNQVWDHDETIGNIVYRFFTLNCCNPGWQYCGLSQKSPMPVPNDPDNYLWEKYEDMIVEKMNYCIGYADKQGIDNVLIGQGSIKVAVPELVKLNSIFVFNFKWEYKDVENGKIRIDAFILKL